MLSVIILADDDRELSDAIAELEMMGSIEKEIIIVDLGLQRQERKKSKKLIQAKGYKKGKVYAINQALLQAQEGAILLLESKVRIKENQLRAMLSELTEGQIITPQIINGRTTTEIASDFLLFWKKSFLDERLISYHYEKVLKGKITFCWTIQRIPKLTADPKAIRVREDYRYKKDLATLEKILWA